MITLAETLTSRSESFKKGVAETMKISPNKHAEIDDQVNGILNEFPYPKLISEVSHLKCALELLCDKTDKQQRLKTKHVIDQVEKNRKYLTSDDEEIVSKVKPLLGEVHHKPTNKEQFKSDEHNHEEKGVWSTTDLIQLVTAMTRNDSEQNRAKFPELDNEACIVQQLERVKAADQSSLSCRQTFESIQTLIQQLKSVGRYITEEDDPLWKQLIYKKFPATIRKQVFLNMQRKSSISWTVNQMLNNIDNLISSTEMYEEDEIRSFVSEPRYTNRINRTDRGTVRNNNSARYTMPILPASRAQGCRM
uniref:Uncharacterized protein n=1 Tax=Heterorhabditis bacteriophora TaxID=37862 RepID=A0A1I7WVM8_HETBA